MDKEWFVERLRERVEKVMRDELEEGGLEKRDWTDWLDWLRRQRVERPGATMTSTVVVTSTAIEEVSTTATSSTAEPTPTIVRQIPGESLPLEIIGPDTGSSSPPPLSLLPSPLPSTSLQSQTST